MMVCPIHFIESMNWDSECRRRWCRERWRPEMRRKRTTPFWWITRWSGWLRSLSRSGRYLAMRGWTGRQTRCPTKCREGLRFWNRYFSARGNIETSCLDIPLCKIIHFLLTVFTSCTGPHARLQCDLHRALWPQSGGHDAYYRCLLPTRTERERENLSILWSVIFCQREYCDNLSHKKHSIFLLLLSDLTLDHVSRSTTNIMNSWSTAYYINTNPVTIELTKESRALEERTRLRLPASIDTL